MGIFENKLQFSNGWLQGFKKYNRIHQQKLQGEAASANQTAILKALPILHEKCANYSFKQIYNIPYITGQSTPGMLQCFEV